MDGGVAIGDHEIKVPHGRKEIEVAIGFVAPPSVVEGVERAVAIVKMGGFIDDELPEVFVESSGVFFEESLERDICELMVPMDVVLMPINGSLIELTGDDLGLGAIKDVAETDGVLFRSFGKSLGVKCEVFVVSITGINSSDVLTRYGRKKDDLGGGFPVVCLRFEMGQELIKAFLESGKAFFSAEGFIVAVGCNDEVAFEVVEMLVKVAEVIGTGHEIDFISWPSKVTNGELMLRMVLVEKSFEVTEAAFGIKEKISDESNTGPGGDLQRKLGFDWLDFFWAGRGFTIDIVFGELWIFRWRFTVSL